MKSRHLFKVLALLVLISFLASSCGNGNYSKHCMCPVRKAT